MADPITLGVAISRPSTPLQLHNGVSFEIPEGGWTPVGKSHRLNELEGENNPGSVLLGFAPDTATINGSVRALGTSEANLRTRITALFSALGQFRYSITETIGGQSTVYTGCRPAQIDPAGGADWDFTRALYRQEFSFSIRCDPRP